MDFKFSQSTWPTAFELSNFYTPEGFLYDLGDSKGILLHIPNWYRVRATTKTTSLDRLRLDVSKYTAVIQATRSTPSGTQLTQYPSSHETIRQQNSRPGVRLPYLIGRCSNKTRAGPLARRYSRWTLREMPPESSTIGEVRKPRIPLDTLVPQIDATDGLGELDNFVESRRQSFREARPVPVKRHQS